MTDEEEIYTRATMILDLVSNVDRKFYQGSWWEFRQSAEMREGKMSSKRRALLNDAE